MDNIFFVLGLISLLAVVASLVLGLISMTRGSEADNKKSNQMMRLRIVSQASAIAFFLLAYLTKS